MTPGEPINATANGTAGGSRWIARIDLLAVVALVVPGLAAWLLPPFAQPQSFHDYADQRIWLGVPHAADVLSNLPFLLIGALGLRLTLHQWPYALLFVGVLLTTFGSAWYHLNPNDATLVWDRLPMAMAFAGLVAGTLADRAPRRAMLFTILFAIVGAGSVVYWHATANLVPYLAMQAVFIAVTLFTAASIPTGYTLANRVYWAAGLYAFALILERLDHFVYELSNGSVSGHTLKHLVASAAIFVIYAMLRDRRNIASRYSNE